MWQFCRIATPRSVLVITMLRTVRAMCGSTSAVVALLKALTASFALEMDAP
jgi:hypothetical protein